MRALRSCMAVAALCVSCFDASISSDVTLINCTGDGQCSPEYPRCRQGRCRRQNEELPIEGPVFEREFVRTGEEIRARYRTPLVMNRGEAWAGQIRFEVERSKLGDFVASGVSDSGVEGVYTMEAWFQDSTGTGNEAPTGKFTIDDTAPIILNAEPPTLTAAPTSLAAKYALQVDEVGPGTGVQVRFTTSEPVSARVWAMGPDGGPIGALEFRPLFGTDVTQVHSAVLDGGAVPQGAVRLMATLTDRAGNPSELPLGHDLVLDTRPPFIDTSTDRDWVIERALHGAADGGPAANRLVVAPAVLPEDGTLFIIELAEVRARVAVDAGSPVDVPVGPFGPYYTVQLLDHAGNPSGELPVLDATLVSRWPPPLAPDRREVELATTFINARHVRPPVSFPPGGVEVRSRGRWQHASDNLVAFSDAPMAFDADRGTMLRLGGRDARGTLNRTLVWEGQGWRDVSASTGVLPPVTTREARLAYDTERQRTVMFEGVSPSTWSWDGTGWQFHPQPSLMMPQRTQFGLAFDERRARVVLFGGEQPDGGLLDDTWEWTGLAWAPVDGGLPPSPRRNAAMGYDPASQRLLLYGGSGGTPGGIDDVWTLGAQWEKATQLPGDRPDASSPMMVRDVRRGEMRVITQVSGGIRLHTLTYSPDSGTAAWAIALDASVPGTLGVLTSAYDSARDELLVTDGFTRIQLPENGRTAVVSRAIDAMVPVTAPAMAFDGRQVVMFGGLESRSGQPTETCTTRSWAWKAEGGWRTHANGADAGGHHGVLVRVDGGMVLAGHRCATALQQSMFWEDTGRWSGLTLALDVGAGASNGGSAIFRGVTDEAYFARQLNQVALSPGPTFAGMVYDPPTRQVIAFGGDQTWSSTALQGGPVSISWSLETPRFGTKPSDRASPTMVYDARLMRPLMFGGTSDVSVWGWRDGGWSEEQVSDFVVNGRPTRFGPAAYDETTGTTVMWAGDYDEGTTETWTLRYAGHRPALLFHHNLVAELGVENLEGVELRRISASARAGGDLIGSGAGSARGAQLMVWSQGHWDSFDAGANPATWTSPQPLSLSIDNPSVVEELLRGHGELSLAVTTAGAHAVDPAQLKVDSFIVHLDYRLSPP